MRCEIQADPTTIEPQIRTVLEDGPDEIIAAMATLRGKLPAIQTLTVRIDTEADKRMSQRLLSQRDRIRKSTNHVNNGCR